MFDAIDMQLVGSWVCNRRMQSWRFKQQDKVWHYIDNLRFICMFEFYLIRCVLLILTVWANSLPFLQAQSEERKNQEQLYNSHCSNCHQLEGEGLPGVFPPLAGHIPDIYGVPEGKRYLVWVLLYGLEGEILVEGKSYRGKMPSFSHLTDQEVASLLNHILTSWKNRERLPLTYNPVDSVDIVPFRNKELSSRKVYELRKELGGERAEVEKTLQTTPEAGENVWISFEQAERGRVVYNKHCVSCHGFSLRGGEFDGVPLSGNYFAKRWDGQSIKGLLAYIKAGMPPGLGGRFRTSTYLDLVAYILKSNGYPEGERSLSSNLEILDQIFIRVPQN